MAKIKQYVGNLRIQSNVVENILVNEDFLMKESRYSSIPIKNKKNTQFQKKGWIDEVANELQSRGIQIINSLHSNPIKTENRIIIDYTIIYCKQRADIKNKINTLRNINYTQMFKKMFLPFELVGMDGRTFTNAFSNTCKCSAIKWDFLIEDLLIPNK